MKLSAFYIMQWIIVWERKKIKDQVQLTRPYMEQDVGLAHIHAIQELKPQRTLTAGIEDD